MSLKKPATRKAADIEKAIAANTAIMKNAGEKPDRAKAIAVNYVNENLPPPEKKSKPSPEKKSARKKN
jgi:hypothetical protein